MSNLIRIMSLEGGALFVIVCSFISGFAIFKVAQTRAYKIIFCLLTPLIVANFVYWISTIGSNSIEEYKSWALLYIGIWYIAAIPFSFLGLFTTRIFKKWHPPSSN
jgi:hypothetical protein